MSLAETLPMAPSRAQPAPPVAAPVAAVWTDTLVAKNEPMVISGVALVDLEERHCRWPVASAPWLFCGDAKARGAYCAAHAALAYREPGS